jgi:hypothetical protein
VFRKPNGLHSKIPQGKKVLADNGYRGQDHQISTPNVHDNEAIKEFKKRAKSRQETVNKRIKDFKIIGSRFCHALEKHKIAFESVCVIVQYDFDNGHPLFETVV